MKKSCILLAMILSFSILTACSNQPVETTSTSEQTAGKPQPPQPKQPSTPRQNRRLIRLRRSMENGCIHISENLDNFEERDESLSSSDLEIFSIKNTIMVFTYRYCLPQKNSSCPFPSPRTTR